jgi:hypothetical protein
MNTTVNKEAALKAKAYERWMQKHLKEIAECKDDVHTNYTPPEICDMMLEKINLSGDKTVLVLYNLELVFALMRRGFKGKITFFTQSERKRNLAPKIFEEITVQYITKEEDPISFMSKWPEKFDIVVANPPYSNNLDLKFLDSAFDLAKREIVFVHPARFILDISGKKSIVKNLLEKIGSSIKTVNLFNGNKIFGIYLFSPISITYLDKSKKSSGFILDDPINGENSIVEDYDMITPFGTSREFWSFYKKVKTDNTLRNNGKVLEKTGNDHLKVLSNPINFFIDFSHIRGNIDMERRDKLYKDDFYTLFKKDTPIKKDQKVRYNIWFEFGTEKEANNFLNYCKTDFARMCFAINKTTQKVTTGLNGIPWMDFTQEWTEEKLYTHFNITEEEQEFIRSVIPPYYE